MRLLLLLPILTLVSPFCYSDFNVTDHIDNVTSEHDSKVRSLIEASRSNEKSIRPRLSTVESYLNSESYITNQNSLKNRISNTLDIPIDTNHKNEPSSNKNILPLGHKVILYISSSMPKSVIHRYAVQLDKVNGVMLLRGTIGGLSKIVPTTKFINQITKSDINCIDKPNKPCGRLNISVRIDPKRFAKNNIKSVPAITFETSYSGDQYCNTGDPEKTSHVVYGDSNLHGLLFELYEISKNPSLELPIDILSGFTRPG